MINQTIFFFIYEVQPSKHDSPCLLCSFRTLFFQKVSDNAHWKNRKTPVELMPKLL